MKVLVTGGAGYIGCHVVRALARRGHESLVYDNLSRGRREAVSAASSDTGAVAGGTGRVLFQAGDLLDRTALEDVIGAFRPAATIHLAGLIAVGESVSRPEAYRANNVDASRNLLEALSRAGAGRLVFASSAAVYGDPGTRPLDESQAPRPSSPYGENKAEVEAFLKDAAAEGRVAAVSLRVFNASGADEDGIIGEDHDPETHLVPLALRAAAGYGPPLTVAGNDYPTPDGTCLRDYVHVADLADAFVLAAEAVGEDRAGRGGAYQVYNLGSGHGRSVLEVLRAVEAVVGCPVPFVFGPRRAGDPAALVARVELARAELAWRPSRSDLSHIAATAWAWHRRHPRGYADGKRALG